MTPDNVQALPPGTMLGDYRLDAVIGHGGFGITYRAFDSQLAKVVAIKEYLPVEFAVRQGQKVVARGARFAEDFAWGRERFLDEARALARFRHPHIVPVMRFLAANGTAYTVMEFEDGRNVGEILREPGRRLPPDEVRRLAEGLLLGLGAVHAQGFLHRDIKPSNIIIRRDGVPILIDFGAARQAMGNRTRTLTSVLTPQYAPIEQYAVDGKQGPWSDIYSAAARAASRHRRRSRRPRRRAGSARIPTGRWPRRRPNASTRRSWRRSIAALAFAPEQRPQSVEEWSKLFGVSLPRAHDAPTQRMESLPAARPTGAAPRRRQPRDPRTVHAAERAAAPQRDTLAPARAGPDGRRGRCGITRHAAARRCLATAAAAGHAAASAAPAEASAAPDAGADADASRRSADARADAVGTGRLAGAEGAGGPGPARRRRARARCSSAPRKPPTPRAPWRAKRASRRPAPRDRAWRMPSGSPATTARPMSARSADGKRQGLGVLEFKDGDRQAGEWKDNVLNGLGIERLSDGPRYEGQWRNGLPAGLGVREKPGSERAEGNFAVGRLEGLGTRRVLTEPTMTQTGEFKGDTLDGLGVETLANGERYEGAFRAGKRHGYGQLIGPDERARASRWDDGKLVESAP